MGVEANQVYHIGNVENEQSLGLKEKLVIENQAQ